MTNPVTVQDAGTLRFTDKSVQELEALIKQVKLAGKVQYNRQFVKTGLEALCREIARHLGELRNESFNTVHRVWQHKGIAVYVSEKSNIVVKVDGVTVADSQRSFYRPGEWEAVVLDHRDAAVQAANEKHNREVETTYDALRRELENELTQYGFDDVPDLPPPPFNKDDWVRVTQGQFKGQIGTVAYYDIVEDKCDVVLERLRHRTEFRADCLEPTDPPPPQPDHDEIAPEADTVEEISPELELCLKLFREDALEVAVPMAQYLVSGWRFDNGSGTRRHIAAAFEAVMLDTGREQERRVAAATALRCNSSYGRDALIKALQSDEVEIRKIAVKGLVDDESYE